MHIHPHRCRGYHGADGDGLDSARIARSRGWSHTDALSARAGVPGLRRAERCRVVRRFLAASTSRLVLSNGTTGAASGSVRIDVLCTDGQAPPCFPNDGNDTEDDRLIVSALDVRCAVGGVPGCSSLGADYVGQVVARFRLRITDHAHNGVVCTSGNGGSPCISATVRDLNFSAPVPCVDNGGGNGGNCSVSTTYDALEPGTVKELQRLSHGIRCRSTFSMPGRTAHLHRALADDPLGLGCPPVCGSGDESPFQWLGFFSP